MNIITTHKDGSALVHRATALLPANTRLRTHQSAARVAQCSHWMLRRTRGAVIAALLIMTGVLLGSSTNQPVRVQTFALTIDKGSLLSIAGTSNFNDFSCFYNETLSQRMVRITRIDSMNVLRFNNVSLKVPTQLLDCNNSRMNSDLCDALRAKDYPYIAIELYEVNLAASNSQAELFDVVATASLTITNVCKPVMFSVRVQRLGESRLRLMCSKEIRMTDFNVVPPTALFGLIKVRNEITIIFDLYTTLRPT